MDRKHALETDEICSEKVSDESKITPRLRAESVGVIANRDIGGHKKSRVGDFRDLFRKTN